MPSGDANLQFTGYAAARIAVSLQPVLAASGGAASTSGTSELSPFLWAMRPSLEECDDSIRPGSDRFTTDNEVNIATGITTRALRFNQQKQRVRKWLVALKSRLSAIARLPARGWCVASETVPVRLDGIRLLPVQIRPDSFRPRRRKRSFRTRYYDRWVYPRCGALPLSPARGHRQRECGRNLPPAGPT